MPAQDILPTSEIIERAKAQGVDFGKGSAFERIRYFIKLGLLPNAVKQSVKGENSSQRLEGHLPEWVIDRLVQINTLNKSGLTILEIKKRVDEGTLELANGQTIEKPKLEIQATKTKSYSINPKTAFQSLIVVAAIIFTTNSALNNINLAINGMKDIKETAEVLEDSIFTTGIPNTKLAKSADTLKNILGEEAVLHFLELNTDIVVNGAIVGNNAFFGTSESSGLSISNDGNITTSGGIRLNSAAKLTSGTGEPSNANGTNGDYYFRVDGTSPNTSLYYKVSNGWVPAGGSSLQITYNASENPEIVLDSTRGALTIRDGATALGANLFEVQNNAGTTTYLGVTASKTTVTGAFTASGDTTLSSALSVSGASTLSGAVTASSTLTVSGASVLSSTLAVSGASTLAGATSITSTTQSTSTTTGSLIVSGGAGIAKNVYIGGDLVVAGATTTTGASSFTGQILASDGTVGAPGYSFSADTDTGIYRSAANTLDFSSGGVRTLQLNTTASGVNYLTIAPGAASSGPTLIPAGSDTNIPLTINSLLTGALTLDSTSTGSVNLGTGSNAKTVTVGNTTGTTALVLNSGTGSQTFTSNVASGTTTTSGFVFDATAITTGTGAYLTTDSVTTGRLLDIATSGNTWTGNSTTHGLTNITSTSTAGTGSDSSILFNLARSGTNANASHTAYGLYSSVTNTGTTSTNVGGYFSASGASNNYAIYSASGSNYFAGPVSLASNVNIAGTTSTGAEIPNQIFNGSLYSGRYKVSNDVYEETNYNFGNLWIAKGSSLAWTGVAVSADGKYQSATAQNSATQYIYTSSDFGATWTARSVAGQWMDVAMSADGRYQVAADGNPNFLRNSSDYGVTWTARDSSRSWIGVAISADGKYQSAVVSSGQIYTSTDYGVTWTARDSSRGWRDVDMSADGKYQSAVVDSGQIYTSTDYGVTWTARDSARNWFDIAVSADGSRQTAVVGGVSNTGQIYTSTDYGVTWTARDSARNWSRVAMSGDGARQLATVFGGNLYISTDYGATWTSKDSSRSWYGAAMSADGKYSLAADNSNGSIYVSIAEKTTYLANIILNESGADSDFRAETDTNSNALVLDAGLFSGVGQLSIGAAAQGTATAFTVIDNPAITATANQNFYKLFIDNNAAVTVPTGTAAVVASLALDEPNITATGTVTDAATLYISGAPTEGSTGNYAFLTAAGSIRHNLAASDKFLIDAATTDSTGTAGALDIDLDTTASQAGIDIDLETITDAGVDTVSGLKVTATATSTDADVIYGLHVANLGGTATAGNEYAIYQAGTSWDYGALFEDDLRVGATDYITLENDGDLLFVDADGAATITGPAGGALNINAASSQALALATTTAGNITLTPAGAGDVVIDTDSDTELILNGGGDGVNSLVLTDGDILVSDGDFDLSGGDFNVTLDAGDGVNIAKGAAPTVDVFTINGGTSATSGVDTLQLTQTISNTSGNVLDVTPTFTTNANATFNIFDLDAFTATSDDSAGTTVTATVRGINIGNITESLGTADVVTSSALRIGTGWDDILNYNGTTVINGSGQIVSTQITGTLLTLSGDTGTDEALAQGNTLEVAGGTNGIDSVISATDTVTLNLDTTEIGTTTFGSGSAITWTFDAGSVDPILAFTSGQVSIGSAVQSTITAFTVIDNPAITATANQNFYKLLVDNSAAVTVPTGTAAVVASLALDEPNITATGTVTDAATLYISGAPTEGSTGNFAFLTAAGNIRHNFAAADQFILDGGTTDRTSDLVTLDVDVNSANVDGMYIDLDVGTALSSSETANGINIDVTGAAGDDSTSKLNGLYLNGDVTSAGTVSGIYAAGSFDTGIDLSAASTTTDLILDDGLTVAQTSDNDLDIVENSLTWNVDFGETTASTITQSSASAMDFTVSGDEGFTFTSSETIGTTTTSAFVFDATAITSGTGAYITSDSITTGKLAQFTPTGNTLTTGTIVDVRATATSLTGAAGTGSLMNLDWSPGSATTATGDLFALNIGTNGTTTGMLFNILDTASSIFSVSETAVTTSLPTNFTGSGDVGVANDLQFTNPTASYIKSLSQLGITAGETFNSSNLTLQTYNAGSVVINSGSSASTGTTGLLNVVANSTTSSNIGFAIDYISDSGVTAAADLFAAKINLTQNDADGDLFGLVITNQASTNAGADDVECLLCIDNAENTASAVTDGIRITSTGVTAGITYDLKLQNSETITNSTDGTISFGVGAAEELILTSAALSPATSDGLALGTTSLMWADLFLASGAVINFNNGDVTLTHAADALTIAGGAVTISGSAEGTASLTQTAGDHVITDGDLTISGGEISATTDDTTTTGFAFVANTITSGNALTLSGTGMTTGEILDLTGTWAPTDGSTNEAIDLNFTHTPTSSADNFSAINLTTTDGTALANTVYNYNGTLTLTGNADKTGIGIYQTVTSSSTTADTLVALDLATSVTGIIASGTGVRDIYGIRNQPSAGAESTADTTNVYGEYIKIAADVATGGTVNGYGLYIANGTYDTDGTSTQTGLYVESPTGADTNYAAIFAGGNVGIGTTSPASKLAIHRDYAFATPTTPTENLYLTSATTSSSGGYGASIGFSRLEYQDRRMAAIVAVQGTADEDQLGLAFFTHPSTSATADIVEAMRISYDGNVYINDSANANMTTGLTINQGSATNNIVSLKGSDVAHGLTTGVYGSDIETDDFARFFKVGGAAGGLGIGAFAENAAVSQSFEVQAYGGTANTTKSTSGTGLINFYVSENDGAQGIDNITDDGNVFSIEVQRGGADPTVLIVDEDGDLFIDGDAVPLVSDGSALGTSSLMWSDLFLASGAVVNFNNGDVTVTHSTNTLAFAGASSGYTFDAALTSTGALTIAPTTTGTFLDFQLETEWTAGTLINADFASGTTQSGAAIIGMLLDLNTNVTAPAAGQNVTGYDIKLPVASTTSNAAVYTGFNLSTAGAITNGTAGSVAWRGGNITMPNITQSAGGSVTSSGLLVTTGSITTAGTQHGLNIVASGVGAGTLNGLNIGSITGGSGTETALNIGSGWDTDINATTSLEVGIGGTNELYLDADDFSPATSDSNALGDTDNMWSDLFLASGAVVNFNNGDVTVTHSTNTLAFAGASSGYTFDDDISTTGKIQVGSYTEWTGNLISDLRVKQTNDDYGAFQIQASGNDSSVIQMGYDVPNTRFSIYTTYNSTGAYRDLAIWAGATGDKKNILLNPLNTGNVGINDPTPDALLDLDSVATTGNIFGILSTTLTTGEIADITATYAPTDGSTNEAIDLNFTHTPTSSADNFSAINLTTTDGTALANTVYNYNGTLTLTGNEAKTGYGIYQTITSSSTTGDTLIAGDFATSSTGIIGTGTRTSYGLRSQPASTGASTAGTHSMYGLYSAPSSTLANGSTENVYGGYFKATGTLASGTVTSYGVNIANPTMNTTGTSTKIGLHLEDLATTGAADSNYGICFDCDGTYSSSTAANGITWGSDANQVTLYRSASDTLKTDDSMLVAGTSLTVTGVEGSNGLILSAGDAAISDGSLSVTDDDNATSFSLTNNTATTVGAGVNTDGVADISSTSLTTGNLLNLETTTALTSGRVLNVTSTSTALTTGNLARFDWTPGSATTATGDLFSLNIGANGTTTGNLFNILDSSSSIFAVSETAFTTSLPTNFTAAGDTSMAYDLNFTNPTASYIKSAAPLAIVAGETFNSSNLTLQTYNSGSVVVDLPATGYMLVDGAFSIGAQQTLTANSTTPSVAAGSHFVTANTTDPTLISNFTSGYNGQILAVEFGDSVTDLDCSSSSLNCGGTDITSIASGDVAYFIYDGTNWNLIEYLDVTSNSQAAGADLAEYFISTEGLEPGDVVSIDPNESIKIHKSSGSYDQKSIGIIATNPGIKLGENTGLDAYTVGLAGRVPTKVSTENGNIALGDYLTSSSIPGVAMKATKPGPVIGKALENYSASGIGSVMVFINISYADPNAVFANVILDNQGNIVMDKIKTSTLTVDSALNINGTSIDLTALTQIGTIASTIEDLQITEATTSATLAEHTSALDELKSNLASASATLAQVNSDIEDLKLTDPETLFATASATIADLTVSNKITTLSLESLDATISGTFKALGDSFLGKTTIAGDLTIDGTFSVTSGNTINALTTLFIQNSPLAQLVDFFNGLVTIDNSGKLTAGEVAGAKVTTNKLTITNDEVASGSAIPAGPTIGTVTITAGQTEIAVITSQVSSTSKIFLTPKSSSGGRTIFVSDIIAESGFVVKIDSSYASDISFDWLIVETK